MVLLGGLEIVAAGYILNEMHKDDKRATSQSQSHSSSDPNRRKKKHRHDHQPRPGRPQQLMPPQQLHRPMSAPPPQSRPLGPGPMPPGAYYQPGPHEVQQYPPNPRPQPQMMHPPPQTQSWPVNMPNQARPPTNAEAAQYYNHRPGSGGGGGAGNPGPVPGQIQHNPTMHFDMKTGKWQSNMLPTDAQAAGGNRSLSGGDLTSGAGPRAVSPLAFGTERGRKGSYSSVSSETGSSSDDDLAYGKYYEKGGRDRRERQRPTRVMSYDRDRPTMQLQGQPVELDWYATQSQGKKNGGAATAMAAVTRDGRASTMPSNALGVPQAKYSASQPDLGVYEMDATSASGGRRSERAQPQQAQIPVELDSRDTQRYRAYRP